MVSMFSVRLKELRAANRITQEQLAKELEIGRSTLAMYEAGKREPEFETLEAIADYFNVDMNFLFGESTIPETLTPPEQTHIRKYRACDDSGKEMVDRVLDYEYHRTKKVVPIRPPETKSSDVEVYYNAAAAGLGNYLDSDACAVMKFPITKIPIGSDFGVYVEGDSMEPKIPNGCIIFIKSCPAIEPGEIGLFSLDGDSYCKKLIVDHDHQEIRLESINPKYGPIIIGPEQTLHTFGKVLGWAVEEDQI